MSGEEGFHVPVLLEETLSLLDIRPGGTYVDATMGGGGHFRAIAQRLSGGGTLIGLDRDPEAIAWNRQHRPSTEADVRIALARFSSLEDVLAREGAGKVDGIVADLGMSSHQLDSSTRGFSYMREAFLDMRMDPEVPLTASALISDSDAKKLADILAHYGEMRNPGRMAGVLKRCADRHRGRGLTSSRLKDCLRSEYGSRLGYTMLAKLFQALRITVNDELGELRALMGSIPRCLGAGGTAAVISYHSLEDRIVKQCFVDEERGCVCDRRIPRCVCGRTSTLKRITRKPIRPAAPEIQQNPRARSARLRAARRTHLNGEAAYQ